MKGLKLTINKYDIKRKDNENAFEHKLRLCLAKLNHEIDLDFSEIANILNLTCSGDHLRKISYGFQEYNEYMKSNQSRGVANRILSFSDPHVPYHLPIEIFSKYCGVVDILQINGDVLDLQSLSRFPKNYRQSPMEEIIVCRQYILNVIEFIKPKKVIVNYGNHDFRLQKNLMKNLDSDILELMPQTPLELIFEDGFNHYDKKNKTKTWYEPLIKVFAESGIDIDYTGQWYCQIGKTIFCHPLAYSSGILKTAEKAVYWFRNEGFDFNSMVVAHTHRAGSYYIGNTVVYEQGACCDTTQLCYNDGRLINSQKQGFIYVCQDVEGNLIKDKTKLIVLN